jgi:hypothetical protein
VPILASFISRRCANERCQRNFYITESSSEWCSEKCWCCTRIEERKAQAILGNRGLGAAVLVWFLSWVTSRLLAGSGIPFWIRSLKWLPAIALFVLVMIGLRHMREDTLYLWQRIWHWQGAFLRR